MAKTAGYQVFVHFVYVRLVNNWVVNLLIKVLAGVLITDGFMMIFMIIFQHAMIDNDASLTNNA